jgi:hypothetical protein
LSASQRRKGQVGERECASMLADEFGVACKRTLDQPREGGCDVHLAPFSIEVKRRKKLGLHAWLKQAEAALDDSRRIPIVLARGDGQEWVGIVPWSVLRRWMRDEM